MEKELILEVGKTYNTRDGRIILVLHIDRTKKVNQQVVAVMINNLKTVTLVTFSLSGVLIDKDSPSDYDIISEYKEPQKADLDLSDAELIMSKGWVKKKDDNRFYLITHIGNVSVFMSRSMVCYSTLRNDYTWTDGSEICKTV